VINALILRFARVFHGEKYRFLTLTTRKGDLRPLRSRRRVFFKALRLQVPSLEYRCTSTDEGNGVCHMCLISPCYLPHPYLRELWGADVHITREKDGRLDALVSEMSLQTKMFGYSMSRGFLPGGSRIAIDNLSRYFRGRLGFQAVEMLSRRWKGPDAFGRTVECCSRKTGWCSDLRSHFEILGCRQEASGAYPLKELHRV
jgi:hypothetical protein